MRQRSPKRQRNMEWLALLKRLDISGWFRFRECSTSASARHCQCQEGGAAPLTPSIYTSATQLVNTDSKPVDEEAASSRRATLSPSVNRRSQLQTNARLEELQSSKEASGRLAVKLTVDHNAGLTRKRAGWLFPLRAWLGQPSS